MRKIILLIGAVFFVLISMVFIAFNKKHRTVEDEVYQVVQASQLFEAFSSNELNANSRYLDKVLEVKGEVAEMTANQKGETIIILKTKDPLYGVSCTLQKRPQQMASGSQVAIKGICTGYLSDVVITRGVLVIDKP